MSGWCVANIFVGHVEDAWWIVHSPSLPVLPFKPKYRLGHPENYLFLLSKNIFTGSKYPKINWFAFEKNFTDRYLQVCSKIGLCSDIATASASPLHAIHRSRKLAATQRYSELFDLEPAHPRADSQVQDQSTECEICHIAVDYIKTALASNQTNAEIEKVRCLGVPSCCFLRWFDGEVVYSDTIPISVDWTHIAGVFIFLDTHGSIAPKYRHECDMLARVHNLHSMIVIICSVFLLLVVGLFMGGFYLGVLPHTNRCCLVVVLCMCPALGAQRSNSWLLWFPACAAWPIFHEGVVNALPRNLIPRTESFQDPSGLDSLKHMSAPISATVQPFHSIVHAQCECTIPLSTQSSLTPWK